MSYENELETLIENDEKVISRAKSLNSLLMNRDFRIVVLEGFLRDHALTLVRKLASPTENKTQVQSELDAVSYFQHYLDSIQVDAEIADKTLKENNDSLFQLRNEGSNL